jgi:hypothetical protein
MNKNHDSFILAIPPPSPQTNHNNGLSPLLILQIIVGGPPKNSLGNNDLKNKIKNNYIYIYIYRPFCVGGIMHWIGGLLGLVGMNE